MGARRSGTAELWLTREQARRALRATTRQFENWLLRGLIERREIVDPQAGAIELFAVTDATLQKQHGDRLERLRRRRAVDAAVQRAIEGLTQAAAATPDDALWNDHLLDRLHGTAIVLESEAADSISEADLLSPPPVEAPPPVAESEPTAFDEPAPGVPPAPPLAVMGGMLPPAPEATPSPAFDLATAIARIDAGLAALGAQLKELPPPPPPPLDPMPHFNRGMTDMQREISSLRGSQEAIANGMRDLAAQIAAPPPPSPHPPSGHAQPGGVVPRLRRRSLLLLVVAIVLLWGVVFWLRSGDLGLTLESFVFANLAACTVLMLFREHE
jgi:hypothetical protein